MLTELPLFPLSAVLLPHGRMPLQIFEQRYLDLVRETLRRDSQFGVVWIRRGSEVAQRGRAAPELGDHGTVARIVDWEQRPNGLLGITIEGAERFDLEHTTTRADGLVVGEVRLRPLLPALPLPAEWLPLLDLLRQLESHPQIVRTGQSVDYNDAWQVAYALLQSLPLEQFLKYQLLGMDDAGDVLREIDTVLRQLSGAD